ncbi:MAG: T9SS type A sorting domain-containing protein [Bacteroidetes bacterium]|nr:T9SS type A sorting domain-containing protein [Bacteroidota bacterium]
MYPNPSNGNFELSFSELSEKTDIILSDGFGKIIHESKNINSTKLNFDILGESGCYFLKIITNDKINVFKIIKI